MTPVLFVVAAAVGAVGRHLLGHVVHSWQALLIANTVGSGLLGAVIAADVSTATVTIIGVGLCSALTTYSSFALQVEALGSRWGTFYAAMTVASACTAASIGTSLF